MYFLAYSTRQSICLLTSVLGRGSETLLFVESVSIVTVSVFDGTSKSFPSAFAGRIFAIMKNKIPMPLYLIAPIRFNLFKMLPDIFPPNYLR